MRVSCANAKLCALRVLSLKIYNRTNFGTRWRWFLSHFLAAIDLNFPFHISNTQAKQSFLQMQLVCLTMSSTAEPLVVNQLNYQMQVNVGEIRYLRDESIVKCKYTPSCVVWNYWNGVGFGVFVPLLIYFYVFVCLKLKN